MPITLKQLASSLAADSASAILHAGLDAPAQSVVSVVVIEDADLCVELIVRRCAKASKQGTPAPAAVPPSVKLSKLQRQIIGVLDNRTFRRADWIAVKVRRENDGNLRNALSGLVRKNLVVKSEEESGYRLA